MAGCLAKYFILFTAPHSSPLETKTELARHPAQHPFLRDPPGIKEWSQRPTEKSGEEGREITTASRTFKKLLGVLLW